MGSRLSNVRWDLGSSCIKQYIHISGSLPVSVLSSIHVYAELDISCSLACFNLITFSAAII